MPPSTPKNTKSPSNKANFQLLDYLTSITAKSTLTEAGLKSDKYEYIVTISRRGTGKLADYLKSTQVFGAANTPWYPSGSEDIFRILLTKKQAHRYKEWNGGDKIWINISPTMLMNYAQSTELNTGDSDFLIKYGRPLLIPIEELIDMGYAELVHPIETSANGAPSKVDQHAVLSGSNSNSKTSSSAMINNVIQKIAKDTKHSEFSLTDFMEGWPRIIALPNVLDENETISIGYTSLDVPLASFLIEKQSAPVSVPIARAAGSVKRGVGASIDRYTFLYQVQGFRDVERNVSGVLNQLLHTPFLPFWGTDELSKIDAIAIKNFSISTIAGTPDSLQVQITAEPFMWSHYCNTLPNEKFEDSICWPLFKIWCETKGKNSRISHLGGNRWSNGRLVFQFPDKLASLQLAEEVSKLEPTKSADNDVYEFFNGLWKYGANARGYVKTAFDKTIEGDPILQVVNTNGTPISIPDSSGKLFVSAVCIRDKQAFFALMKNFKGCFGVYPLVSSKVPVPIVTVDLGNALDMGALSAEKLAVALASNSDKKYAQAQPDGTAWVEASDETREDWQKYSLLIAVNPLDPAEESRFKSLVGSYIGKKPKETKTQITNSYEISNTIAENLRKRYNDLNKLDAKNEQQAKAWSEIKSDAQLFEIATEANSDTVVIEEISVSREHNLTHHQIRGFGMPSHQYMGTSDALITIRGVVFDEQEMTKLHSLLDEVNKRSRASLVPTRIDNPLVAYSGYTLIENDVCSLMGVDFVLPLSVSFQAKESDPGAWDFTLTMVEYDPVTQGQESARELQTVKNLTGKPIDFNGNVPPWVATTEQFLEVEKQLKDSWEPYPEMSLPKWKEVDDWIKVLTNLANGNKAIAPIEKEIEAYCYPWIKNYKESLLLLKPSNNLEGWADPDFYMAYWKKKGKTIVPEAIGSVPMFEALNSSFGDPKTKKKSPLDEKKEEKRLACNTKGEPISANIIHRQSDKDDHKGVMLGDTLTLAKRDDLAFRPGPRGVNDPKYLEDNLIHEDDGQEVLDARIESFAEMVDVISAIDPHWGERIRGGAISAVNSLTTPSLTAPSTSLLSSLPPEAMSSTKAEEALKNIGPQNPYGAIKAGWNVPWTKDPSNYGAGEWPKLRNDLVKSIGELEYIVEKSRENLKNKSGGSRVDYKNWPLPALVWLDYSDGTKNLTTMEKDFATKGQFVQTNKVAPAAIGGGAFSVPEYHNAKFMLRGTFFKSALPSEGSSWEFTYFNRGRAFSATAYQAQFINANQSLEDFMMASQRNKIYITARSYDTKTTQATYNEIALIDVNKSGLDLLYNDDGFRIVLATTCTDVNPVGSTVDQQLMRAIYLTTGAVPSFESKDGLRSGIGQLTEEDKVKYIDSLNKDRDDIGDNIAASVLKYSDHRTKWQNIPVLALYAYRLGDDNFCNYLVKAINAGLKAPSGATYNKTIGNVKDILPRVCLSLKKANSDSEKINWYRELASKLLSFTNLDSEIGPAVEFVHSVYHSWKAGTVSHGLTTFNKDNDTIIGWNNQSLFFCKGVSNTAFKTQGMSDLYCPVHNNCPENKFWNEEEWTSSTYYAKDATSQAVVKAVPVVVDESHYRRAHSIYAPRTARGIVGAFKDSYEYDNSGRLVNAFPNYLVLFIDEGSSFGRIKLWDKYYIRGAISEIEVNTSKDRPTAVAQVTLSNLFSRLNTQSIFENTRQQIVEDMRRAGITPLAANPSGAQIAGDALKKVMSTTFDPLLYKTIPEWITKAWQTHINKPAISAGTRLHIRMGYGSNPAALPTCFNGTISEMPVNDGMLTLVALSDGAELTNMLTHSLTFDEGKNPIFWQRGQYAGGKEPAAIMHDMFSARGAIATLSAGTFLSDANAGLAHWGNMWFIGELGSLSNRYNPTEIQINMYTSSPNLERDYSIWRNFFNVNVFYNFDDVNLIGVKVKEPTPWKVCQVLRKAVFDYIAYPYPFQFRHTMFYGNRWYPLYYRYNQIPLVSPDQEDIIKKVAADQAKINNDTSIMTEDQAMHAAIILMLGKGYIPFTDRMRQWEADLLAQKQLTDDEIDMYRIGKQVQGIWDGMTDEARNAIPVPTGDNAIYLDVDMNGDMYEDYKNTILKYWKNIGPSNVAPTPSRAALSFWNSIAALNNIEYRITSVPMQDQIAGANHNYYGFKVLNLTDEEINELNDPEWISQFMDWKPFCQVHFIDSQINLIANDVTASDETVYTNATGIYNYGGMNLLWLGKIANLFTGTTTTGGDYVAQTRVYSVDTDIMPHYQRTMLVDTCIYTDWMMAGWQSISGVSEIANSMGHPATPAVENVVVSSLLDSVKTMYQGWFVIQGSPTMWPLHMVYVNDARSTMSGLAGVREVTQHFSATIGYVTGVAPECIVVSRSSQHEMLWINSVTAHCQRQAALTAALGTFSFMWRAWSHLEKIGRWDDAQSLAKMIDRELPSMLEGVISEAEGRMVADTTKTRTSAALSEALDEEAANMRRAANKPIVSYAELAADERALLDKTIEAKYAQLGGLEADLAKIAKAQAKIDAQTSIRNAWQMFKEGDTTAFEFLVQYGFDTKESRPLAALCQKVSEIKLEQEAMRAAGSTERQILQYGRDKIGTFDREQIKEIKKYMLKRKPAAVYDGTYSFFIEDTSEVKKSLLGSRWARQSEGYTGTDLTNMFTKVKEDAEFALRKADEIIDLNKQAFLDHPENFPVDNEMQGRALQRKLAKEGYLTEGLEKTTDDKIIVKKLRPALPNVQADVDAIELLVKPSVNDFLLSEAKAASTEIVTLGKITSGPKSLMRKAAGFLTSDFKYRKEAENTIKFVRRMMSGEGMLASIATGQLHLVAIQVAYQIVQLVMFDTFMDAFNDYFTARQIAAIFPLKVGYIPLLAGLLGHQGCVVGDEPGMMDNLITSLTGGKVGENADQGFGWLTTILSAVGVQPASYNIIGADTKNETT